MVIRAKAHVKRFLVVRGRGPLARVSHLVVETAGSKFWNNRGTNATPARIIREKMMAATQTAVVEVSAADRESEFVELFRQYNRKAYHYALQTVGDPDDALDITQEAFLRIHRHWARRDRSRPFGPWLYAVVRNLSIDLFRRRSTRKECSMDDAAPEPSPLPNPETAAHQRELSQRLWREIQRLPEVQREALLLRDWHGLSYAEIAAATGASVTTINSRLHDARVRLRERLRRYL